MLQTKDLVKSSISNGGLEPPIIIAIRNTVALLKAIVVDRFALTLQLEPHPLAHPYTIALSTCAPPLPLPHIFLISPFRNIPVFMSSQACDNASKNSRSDGMRSPAFSSGVRQTLSRFVISGWTAGSGYMIEKREIKERAAPTAASIQIGEQPFSAHVLIELGLAS